MSIDRAAGALLVGLPIAFNVFFFLLARLFDYPAILRSPVGDILSRFQAGGLRLKLIWYGFMLTAVLFAPLAVLLGQVLARDGLELVPVATTSACWRRSCSSSGSPAGRSSSRRWRAPTRIPTRARRHARRRRSCSTPSTATSASPSASASATSSPARGRCSSASRCSSRRRSTLARLARHRRRRAPRRRLARVRRPLRGARLELAGTIVPIAYTAGRCGSSRQESTARLKRARSAHKHSRTFASDCRVESTPEVTLPESTLTRHRSPVPRTMADRDSCKRLLFAGHFTVPISGRRAARLLPE